tara:strand:+ start:78 stop:251 length:174 start_codon:yes stop_codon:yes gene_type:complete
MKFTTIAIFALINNTRAVSLNPDVSDLFNDDSEEMEINRSLAQTEREMGRKLGNSLG